jgi:hypothetical protein
MYTSLGFWYCKFYTLNKLTFRMRHYIILDTTEVEPLLAGQFLLPCQEFGI